MTIKEAEKLPLGSLVRQSWRPDSPEIGMVLARKYVRKAHTAKCLGSVKNRRYDFEVQWISGDPRVVNDLNSRKSWYQNWELMVVSKCG